MEPGGGIVFVGGGRGGNTVNKKESGPKKNTTKSMAQMQGGAGARREGQGYKEGVQVPSPSCKTSIGLAWRWNPALGGIYWGRQQKKIIWGAACLHNYTVNKNKPKALSAGSSQHTPAPLPAGGCPSLPAR
nr:hypothetical protein [Morchella crassipes]